MRVQDHTTLSIVNSSCSCSCMYEGSGLQFLWSHQATQRHVNVKQKEKNASIKTVLFRAIDIGMYLSRE